MPENFDQNERRIRILLADDHRMMRDGLRLSLEQEPDMEVVGEAGDEATTLRLAKELCPDIVTTDITIQDGNGVELSHKIRLQCPETRIVIVTALPDAECLDVALAAGIRNYVLKSDGTRELHTAIRRAVRNETYLSQEAAAKLVESYQQLRSQGRSNSKPLRGGVVLSERERMLLRLVSEGKRNKEIAARMAVTSKSVETYRFRLMRKLGCVSAAELIRYAIREGIIQP